MTVPDARRLRESEKEDARLNRLPAERDLEVDALKAVLAQKSSRWWCAVERSNSSSLMGPRNAEPVSCCRARPSAGLNGSHRQADSHMSTGPDCWGHIT